MTVSFFSLSLKVSCGLLGLWLDLKAIVALDSAICNHAMRVKLIRVLSAKELGHHKPVLVLGKRMVQWLYKRSLKINNVRFGAETERSHVLVQYFTLICDCVRSVHFFEKCNEMDTMHLVACYCKYITVLRCTNVALSFAFHTLLLVNPNIQEIWLNGATCKLDGIMDDLSMHKLRLLCVKGTVGKKGFPWSDCTFSDSLQRVEIHSTDHFITDLSALTLNCPSLRSISWEKMQISDTNMELYLSCRPELINLSISGNRHVMDSTVLFIAKNLPCLRTLNIQKCKNLTMKSLLHIAEYCKRLEALYVDVTADGFVEQIVEEFSHKCASVTYLNICSDFVLCSTTCSLSLITGCPALQTLVINAINNISPTTRGLCAILRPQLKILLHDESTEFNVLTLPI